MTVDCESPKPLRPDVKAGRSLRKDEQEQEHTQANEAKYHHFDFSVSQTRIHAKTPLRPCVEATTCPTAARSTAVVISVHTGDAVSRIVAALWNLEGTSAAHVASRNLHRC